MGNRRDALLLGAIALALVALALLLRPRADADAQDPRISSFLSGPDGARALFLALEELGVPVERSMEPWTGALRPGVLVLLAPANPPAPPEIEALMGWLRTGGILLYGVPGGAGAPGGGRPLARELGLSVRSLAPDSLGALDRVRWETGRAEGVAGRSEAHPWTREIDAVPGFRRAFSEGDAALQNPDAEVLLRTAEGAPVAITFPVDGGRVVAWSDPRVFGNEALREDQAAAFLFVRAAVERLAAGEGVAAAEGLAAAQGLPAADTIRFDEFHQGYRADGGPLLVVARFFTGTPAGLTVLQMGVAGLLVLLLAGQRLGSPTPETTTRRRSPLEHVGAVAGAYGKARANRTARRLLLAGLERRLGRRPAPQGATTPAARSAGGSAADRLAAERDRPGDTDLVALVLAIDAYVEEVRGWKRAK